MMARSKTTSPETEQAAAEAPLQDAEGAAAVATAEALPEAPEAHGAEFTRLDAQAPPEAKTSLDLIMDLELRLTAELGRTELMIRDLLQLGPGSIIELDKTVGEPVDVLVNNRLVARGEVVVIDDSFGVRITEIVTPMERAQSIASPEVKQA
jgi:flagellar motor switch protein FliN/FliY